MRHVKTREEARDDGLLYYQTGKPCRRGHYALRYTSSGACTDCHYERRVLLRNGVSRLLLVRRVLPAALPYLEHVAIHTAVDSLCDLLLADACARHGLELPADTADTAGATGDENNS